MEIFKREREIYKEILREREKKKDWECVWERERERERERGGKRFTWREEKGGNEDYLLTAWLIQGRETD